MSYDENRISDLIDGGLHKQDTERGKILNLTLKKKWFDMIASGEKKEEYRELKQFWMDRLMHFDIVSRNSHSSFKEQRGYKHFDYVLFKNGYAKNAPVIKVEFLGIEIGEAKPEWSDNWKGDVFVIKLGEIVTP